MKAGWEVKPLGEVCEYARGLTYKKSDEIEHSTKRVLRANNIDREASALDYSEIRYLREDFEIPSAKKVARGSILICTASGSKSHLGKVAIVDTDQDFAFGGFMGLITPKNGLLPQFLHYTMISQAYHDFIDQNTDGANINNLKFSQLAEFAFPIPPLEEQKQIVAVLDAAFEGLTRAKENAEANLQNARELFERSVKRIFSDLVSTHSTTKLSDVTSKITKGSSPKWQGISYVDSPGVLFVTSENVGKNQLLLEKTKYVEEAFNQKDKKSVLAKGDVLTNIVGASIGRTAVYDINDVANINQAVCLMRCLPDRLLPNFLSYLLNSPYFKARLHDGESNMARANLSLTFFREFEVPLPNVREQQKTVDQIDLLASAADECEAQYTTKLTDIADLRQSLLQKAFAGELT